MKIDLFLKRKIIIFTAAMLMVLYSTSVFAGASEDTTEDRDIIRSGYFVDESDGTVYAWKEIETTYAALPENYYQVVDSGNKYILDEDGTVLTGWYSYYPYGLVYLDPDLDGAAVTGLKTFSDSGISTDITYLFNSDGILQSDAGTPVLSDGSKVWVNTEGTISTGWLYLGNWKMYFNPKTYAAYTDKDGVVTIDGKQYLFNKDGVMQNFAGTTEINGDKYWFSTDDASLKTGWLTLGDWNLYFNQETYKAYTDKDGEVVIDGVKCRFNKDGVLVSYIKSNSSGIWPYSYEPKPGETDNTVIPYEE